MTDMLAQLVVRTGTQPERVFDINQTTVTLGRDARNDVVIADAEVSRRHATLNLSPEEASYILEDLGSTNGTFVNGRRLSGAMAIQHGDTIELGQAVTIVFRLPASVLQAALTMPMSPLSEDTPRTPMPPVAPPPAAAPVEPAQQEEPPQAAAPPPTSSPPEAYGYQPVMPSAPEPVPEQAAEQPPAIVEPPPIERERYEPPAVVEKSPAPPAAPSDPIEAPAQPVYPSQEASPQAPRYEEPPHYQAPSEVEPPYPVKEGRGMRNSLLGCGCGTLALLALLIGGFIVADEMLGEQLYCGALQPLWEVTLNPLLSLSGQVLNCP